MDVAIRSTSETTIHGSRDITITPEDRVALLGQRPENISGLALSESSLLDSFRHSLDEAGLHPSTTRAYLVDAHQFVEWLYQHKKDLYQASSEDLHAFTADLLEGRLKTVTSMPERYAPSTVVRKISSLRRLYGFLTDRGDIDRNPYTNFGIPEVSGLIGKIVRVTLSSAELKRLLDAPDELTPRGLRDRMLLMSLSIYGLSVLEGHRAQLSDLDMVERKWRLIGRNRKARVVPLHEPTLDIINSWITARQLFNGSSSALFIALKNSGQNYGGRLSRRSIRKVVDKYLQIIGAKQPGVSCDTLRLSCSTELIAKGIPSTDIGIIFGVSRKTIQTLQNLAETMYAHN